MSKTLDEILWDVANDSIRIQRDMTKRGMLLYIYGEVRRKLIHKAKADILALVGENKDVSKYVTDFDEANWSGYNQAKDEIRERMKGDNIQEG